MLDDLAYIHRRDTRDLLGSVSRQIDQLTEVASSLAREHPGMPIQNIVFVGGVEAQLAGQIIQSWAELKVPLEIVCGFELPAYAGSASVCIMVGRAAEEEAYTDLRRQVRERSVMSYVIGSEETLLSTFSVVRQTTVLLEGLGLVAGKKAALEAVAGWLKLEAELWAPEIATAKNPAKQLALEMLGKSIVVYGGAKTGVVAVGWKVAVNYYAKQLAWAGRYPQAMSSEVIGWTRQPIHRPYVVVDLRSELEDRLVRRQFEVAERFLSGMRPTPHVIQLSGETSLAQILAGLILGEYVAIYLALLNGIDPMSGSLDDKLKQLEEK